MHGTVFEEFTRNSRTYRYNTMSYIDAHEKHQPSYFDDNRSGGGNLLPSNSTTEALVSLSTTINLVNFWLQCLEHNYIESSYMYCETMKGMFQKFQFNFLNHLVIRGKANNYYMLLDVMGT